MFNGMDLIVGHGAKDFDQNVFVGANARHGIVQFLHIKVDDRREQGHQQVLKVAARLRFDVLH